MSNEVSEFEAAFRRGVEAGVGIKPAQVGDNAVPFVILPDGYSPVSLEEFLDRPRVTKASVVVHDQASFVAYINRFKGADTTLFANQQGNALTCILDYHGGQAGHCAHKVSWTLKLSDEWQAWTLKDNRGQTQDAFATFLEDRVKEIAEPDGALILHVAEHFEAKKTVVYRKAIRKDNDTVRFEYSEDADGGNGEIAVPTHLVLGLRVYDHQEKSDAYRVDAKLRWGLHDSKITFTYKLEKPQDVLKDAFQGVLKQVAEATGLVPLHGAPG